MKHVLIVDDAITVRMYHRQIIESPTVTVEESENGIEALEKLLTNEFDLILVDVNMPKMDGYSFLKELRANPGLRSIPAIMISTENEMMDKEKAYLAGANMYLVKPIRPEILQSYVSLLVGENT